NHVIEGADEIAVILDDGTRLPATLRGQDAKTDLALLEIKAGRPLPYISWEESEAARVGDWVVAVGNPFGLGGTVTVGIISARGRDIQSGPFDDFIQIDAPINRGNSGGPLFDTQGQVIGVNTAIYSPNGGSVGIGFAVPASLARSIIAEIKEQGRVERGWLGVSIQPVTRDIADGLGLADDKGALIAGVLPDGPAARAGLKQGDVILNVNGRPVDRFKDLPRLVAAAKSGESAKVAIWRQGERQSVAVTLGRMPEDEARVAGRTDESGAAARSVGLSLSPLSEQARRRYGLSDDVQGVLVVGVDEGGAAARRGLKTGDVIVEANRAAVEVPGDVVREVERAVAAERKAILLLVNQRGDERFIAIPLKRT
ncbi:MAG TPA: trypsin-like peptidase domain-containing protein, partial [Rhodospirillales bacterium]|nr:trypsin-like peptidase domain-containing protein [Rhodospirillales bacterium]